MARPRTRKLVCHLGKLKGHQLTGVQIHHQREKISRTNPDIDYSKSHLNYDLHNLEPIKFLKEAKRKIEKRAPRARIRKDSNLVIEAEISAGRKFWEEASPEEQRRFFEEAYRFMCNRVGRENVLYGIVHLDESTPHMHFGFCPITRDGRLNSKDVIMERKKMGKLHAEFYEWMKRRGFRIEKGEPAKEKHIQPQRWKYEQVSKHLEQATRLLEKRLEALRGINGLERWIDGIEVKEKGVFRKDRVELKKTDWEFAKQEAKRAAIQRIDIQQLRNKVKILEQTRDMLKKDRQSLLEEREKAREYEKLVGRLKEFGIYDKIIELIKGNEREKPIDRER